MADQEKRKANRISGHYIVSYRVLDKDENIDISQAKDISSGGMFLTTSQQLAPGTNLKLDIKLPNCPEPISIYAEVVDSQGGVNKVVFNTRVRFLKFDEENRKMIEDLVEFYHKKG